jgi:hypothetical protein
MANIRYSAMVLAAASGTLRSDRANAANPPKAKHKIMGVSKFWPAKVRIESIGHPHISQ